MGVEAVANDLNRRGEIEGTEQVLSHSGPAHAVPATSPVPAPTPIANLD